jgi:CDP-paratose 2-epimerase
VSLVIVTGSGGLIGSQAARHFHGLGFDVWGIDNDLRAQFFGPEASTRWMQEDLQRHLHRYRHYEVDIRDAPAIDAIFRDGGSSITAVIHTAAQPSHDWAARDPIEDFTINANGTLLLLEATRQHSPEAAFVFTSTNKVYGDTPNSLPLVETATRYDLMPDHPFYQGIDESMTIDASTHSLFGVSKASSDLLVQEYGRYFGMATVSFRGGCLTGPGHSGAELHGFLAYLMKCAATGKPYTVFGFEGKQVRDNIHSADLVSAFENFVVKPRSGVAYNIGGGRFANCSMVEAIALCERIAERDVKWTYNEVGRVGDHKWWISDYSAFARDYPSWSLKFDVEAILKDIHSANVERWKRAS